jgi:hypothetical protein
MINGSWILSMKYYGIRWKIYDSFTHGWKRVENLNLKIKLKIYVIKVDKWREDNGLIHEFRLWRYALVKLVIFFLLTNYVKAEAWNCSTKFDSQLKVAEKVALDCFYCLILNIICSLIRWRVCNLSTNALSPFMVFLMNLNNRTGSNKPRSFVVHLTLSDDLTSIQWA